MKLFFFRIKSSKSRLCGCGKGCGHKWGSSGVAYDDSYCDKFKGFTRQQFWILGEYLDFANFSELLPSEFAAVTTIIGRTN